MKINYSDFERRKQAHVQLALLDKNQARESHALDAFHLLHEAMPDLNHDEVNLVTQRFGQAVPNPFLISSMTAGHEQAPLINRHLMEAAARSGWSMGVGSQRRELFDKDAAFEWNSLRRDFPDVQLLSNIGMAQLIEFPVDAILKLAENINAHAIIIHCNPLQEMLQPEGTPYFKGCWQALEHLVKQSMLPIVVKETGCGFSLATLKRLNNTGVAAVDVSGLGGTHWGRIEGCRAPSGSLAEQAAITFKNWGNNTLTSVVDAASLGGQFEVWGSGGVRHGLDAAKLLALGATTVGFAKPLLAEALHSAEAVYEVMQRIEYELKIAMFCTGSRVISELKEKACR